MKKGNMVDYLHEVVIPEIAESSKKNSKHVGRIIMFDDYYMRVKGVYAHNLYGDSIQGSNTSRMGHIYIYVDKFVLSDEDIEDWVDIDSEKWDAVVDKAILPDNTMDMWHRVSPRKYERKDLYHGND